MKRKKLYLHKTSQRNNTIALVLALKGGETSLKHLGSPATIEEDPKECGMTQQK